MLRRGDSQFVIEAVVPDFSHIIPIVYYTMLDGIAEFQDTFFGLGFFTNIYIFVVHSDHNIFVFRPTDNGWERGLGGIITGQTRFTHTWPVINDDRCSLLLCRCHIYAKLTNNKISRCYGIYNMQKIFNLALLIF